VSKSVTARASRLLSAAKRSTRSRASSALEVGVNPLACGAGVVGDAAHDGPVAEGALLAAGEKTYRLYCVACHQPDGRGIPGGAANFRDDKTRLAKSDADLLKIIADGNDVKGMPAFGAMLSTAQRRAVLTYVRTAFGEKKSEK
jgi:mono/diheme cytochrome c family protein